MAAAAPTQRSNAKVAFMAAGFALAMLGLGFASAPLYRLFCQVTGFGGTTMRATESDAALAERLAASAGAGTISVRFDASQDRGLPWRFRPAQSTQQVAIGQRQMAFYTARNNSDRAITGRATYNVEPEQAAPWFNKIQCFCFTEQTLQPGEEVRMPVLYYIDPKAKDDPLMADVEQVTLSYTFHQAKDAP
ncbi:MAG: cytochrome c oxidase assembly protein [Qipengyuania sp.]|jgi:cytochrome c oxidase assembly protein subunit 11|nr:cytochrome c oxidase assembly protein [Qipengyuania sp.]